MIKIYVKVGCPYCSKVLRKINDLELKNGADYILVDAPANTPGRAELIRLGGIGQVPFIYDEDANVKMYESEDIAAYLEKKFSRTAKSSR